MWPRIVELALGLWLLVSPLALPTPPEGADRWVTWLAGAAVLLFSGAAFSSRFRKAHLATVGVALLTIAWGWASAPRPGPAWAQSLILTGLVLGLTAVVPTEAFEPPRGWREYVAERE